LDGEHPINNLHWWQDLFCTVEIQTQICKIDSARSIQPILSVVIYLFVCSSFHDLFLFSLVQKSLPGFFQTGSGAFAAAPSMRPWDAVNYLEKAFCTSKAILPVKQNGTLA